MATTPTYLPNAKVTLEIKKQIRGPRMPDTRLYSGWNPAVAR
jgi:hypothetical protein